MTIIKKPVYRISFYNQDELYEIYAASIADSDIFGFLEVEQILFGENSSLVVDPIEERLKYEFADVKTIFIPIQNINLIASVEKEGIAKARAIRSGEKSSVSLFPQRHK